MAGARRWGRGSERGFQAVGDLTGRRQSFAGLERTYGGAGPGAEDTIRRAVAVTDGRQTMLDAEDALAGRWCFRSERRRGRGGVLSPP